jgi:hypothetical protein
MHRMIPRQGMRLPNGNRKCWQFEQLIFLSLRSARQVGTYWNNLAIAERPASCMKLPDSVRANETAPKKRMESAGVRKRE